MSVRRISFAQLLDDKSVLHAGCVGARATPKNVLDDMFLIGKTLVTREVLINSGNGDGPDQKYVEGGSKSTPVLCTVYLPWSAFNRSAIPVGVNIRQDYSINDESLAKQVHPYWNKCSSADKKLLTRNAAIARNSEFMIGYVDSSKPGGGGTGHAFNCARAIGKPCWDIAQKADYDEVMNWIKAPIIRRTAVLNSLVNMSNKPITQEGPIERSEEEDVF